MDVGLFRLSFLVLFFFSPTLLLGQPKCSKCSPSDTADGSYQFALLSTCGCYSFTGATVKGPYAEYHGDLARGDGARVTC